MELIHSAKAEYQIKAGGEQAGGKDKSHQVNLKTGQKLRQDKKEDDQRYDQ